MKNPYSFDSFLKLLMLRKVPFLVTFFCVVIVSYALLYVIDFIPEPIEETQESVTEEVTVVDEPEEMVKEPVIQAVAADPLPISIYFDDLDKEIKVLNPASSAIADLDEALLKGAVRHPESATFGEDGNIFILAHSSYLPNVLNKNFQAFNDIQKLSWGDTIRLQSNDTEYIYRVQRVYQDKASDIFVPDTPGEAKLTLATCNVLGAKEDRYMVEAELVSSKKL